MRIKLEEDDYLKVKLLYYDRPTPLTERFSILEMSTLQATTLFPPDRKILEVKIWAPHPDGRIVDDKVISTFKTIQDFNDFFIKNPDFSIDDCDLFIADDIVLSSHDDGEVSIQIPIGSNDFSIIVHIFESYNLDKKLIPILKSKPGHYFLIDEASNIAAEFVDFDDYLKHGRD